MRNIIVQKYGGSSVANTDRIQNVAKRIIKYKRLGNNMVVVVSALGDTTDELIELSERAIRLPFEDVPGKKALAAKMEDPAKTAVENAGLLREHASTVTAMPIPEGDYWVQAEVGGLVGNYSEFAIGGAVHPAQATIVE